MPFDKLDNFWTLLIFIAIFLLVQAILYLGVEVFEGEPHDVSRKIDSRIPFKPAFLLIYVTWFPLIAITPILLYYSNRNIFMIYMMAMAVEIVISITTYLVYPTTFTRPPSDSKAVKLMRFASFKQINCAPSMHCSMSYIVIFAAVISGLAPWVILILVIDGIMIPVSTLFTKQHVVIDVLTAIPYAVVAWVAGLVCYNAGMAEAVFKTIGL